MARAEKALYECFLCRKRGVKLWCNCYGEEFICAECAEKRQAPLFYKAGPFGSERDGECLPRWTVDENGTIPSWTIPGGRETELSVDIRDKSNFGISGCTSYLPASKIERIDGEWFFVPYKDIPDAADRWEALPTRFLLLYAGD